MKKILMIILTIVVAVFVYINVNADMGEIVIPNSAIRVRVIANSNSLNDQSMKMKVKKIIEEEISYLLVGIDNVEEARTIIESKIDNLDKDIEVLFLNNNYKMDYRINFGYNHFPKKDYMGIHYEEGDYESLVVTIGEGIGDNWWCVLFPPLCLLEASESEINETEYKFFVVEMLEKIFS